MDIQVQSGVFSFFSYIFAEYLPDCGNVRSIEVYYNRSLYRINWRFYGSDMKKENFQLLTSENYAAVVEFNKAYPSVSCEWSLSNLLLYCDTYRWHTAVKDGRLWIASFQEQYLFYPKGSPIAPDEFTRIFRELAADEAGEWVCGDVPADFAAGSDCSMICDPGEADYIYDLEHLASFRGSKLRKRHNQVRQFEREYEERYRVKNIEFDHLDLIINFARNQSGSMWDSPSGTEEKLAFGRLKELWHNADAALAGIMLEVDDVPVGFSIYSPLTADTVDVHFEKADHAYRGCGAKLTAALVEHLLDRKYRFMNREQDLNEPGLRRAKEALDPVRKLERALLRLV